MSFLSSSLPFPNFSFLSLSNERKYLSTQEINDKSFFFVRFTPDKHKHGKWKLLVLFSRINVELILLEEILKLNGKLSSFQPNFFLQRIRRDKKRSNEFWNFLFILRRRKTESSQHKKIFTNLLSSFDSSCQPASHISEWIKQWEHSEGISRTVESGKFTLVENLKLLK